MGVLSFLPRMPSFGTLICIASIKLNVVLFIASLCFSCTLHKKAFVTIENEIFRVGFCIFTIILCTNRETPWYARRKPNATFIWLLKLVKKDYKASTFLERSLCHHFADICLCCIHVCCFLDTYPLYPKFWKHSLDSQAKCSLNRPLIRPAKLFAINVISLNTGIIAIFHHWISGGTRDRVSLYPHWRFFNFFRSHSHDSGYDKVCFQQQRSASHHDV